MLKLNSLIKKELIYEGLIHSVNMDVASDMIDKWSGSGDKFYTIEKHKKIQLNFKENLTKKELDQLIRLINSLGWFVSSFLVSESHFKWEKFDLDSFVKNNIDKTWLSFQLEAKYDLELNIRDFDVVYHVSPSIYKEKILKIGLVPKSKEKITSHPERVYFTSNEDDANKLSPQLFKHATDMRLSLFKIDFRGARRSNPAIRFFDDPNFDGGFYTLSNIPPQFITWDGEIID